MSTTENEGWKPGHWKAIPNHLGTHTHTCVDTRSESANSSYAAQASFCSQLHPPSLRITGTALPPDTSIEPSQRFRWGNPSSQASHSVPVPWMFEPKKDLIRTNSQTPQPYSPNVLPFYSSNHIAEVNPSLYSVQPMGPIANTQSTEWKECLESVSQISAQSNESAPLHSADKMALTNATPSGDDRNRSRCKDFRVEPEFVSGRSTPSGSGESMCSSTSDNTQTLPKPPIDAPKESTITSLPYCENLSSCLQNERASLVRLARVKLRHAKLQVVTALTRQQSLTESSALPPISALGQSLLVNNISSFQNDLVRLLPEPIMSDPGNVIFLPDDADSEEALPNDLHKKSKALRKNLLLLKKKNLELTLRNHQQQLEPTPSSNGEVKERNLPNKETLKKRQEDLQLEVDAAYWKRLVIKQRNLLAAEKKEIAQYEEKLLSCQEEIRIKERSILECELNIQESHVREKRLDKAIDKTAQSVLAARKRRHDMQSTSPAQGEKYETSNHDMVT